LQLVIILLNGNINPPEADKSTYGVQVIKMVRGFAHYMLPLSQGILCRFS